MRYVMAAILAAFSLGPAAAQTPQQGAAQATPEVLSGVYSCTEITEGGARLACFDAAVGRLRTAETQGDVVAVDRSRVETIQRESFGFNLPQLSRLMPRLGGRQDEPIASVQMQVERIIGRADGRSVFVLADGQRWAQVEAQSTRNVRPGDTVTIRRAALGSYMLVSARGGAAHRVRRET